MRQLSVVHIISALPVGGVERNLLRVLPLLQGEDFRVQVACTREHGELAPALEKAGIPVTLVKLRTRYDPPSLWRFGRWLKQQNADLVQCHMRRPNTSGRLAAILGGIPIRIATLRNMGTDKTWRHCLVDRLLARWTDTIVGVTQGVVDRNREQTGLPSEKYRVIHTGIDLERFANMPARSVARETMGLPNHGPVIGFVGRLHPVKNLPAILKAMTHPALANATLAVVGDGRDEIRAEYETLAQNLGIAPRVMFTGFRDDLPMVYASLNCLVMASHHEGIANAQMEALAAGVPLVTTKIGFAAEALTPDTHFLLAASDAPDILGEALANALEPDTAKRLATEGRTLIRDYSIQKQADRMASLYRELAERHRLQ